MSNERITIEAAQQLVAGALEVAATSPANAAAVARALVNAEIDGQAGHGLSRVASYAAQSRSGKVDGRAVPRLQQTRPGSAMVDAAHGFAYPAVDVAVPALVDMAGRQGTAAVAIRRSHHFGVAGHHVERLATAGLIALAFANTPLAMAAWGGKRPVFGTNPLAFAAPRRNAPPLVIDMALTEVARGRILTADRKGEAIPLGWALDTEGQPTADPKAALAGSLLPMGGAKGAALAMMVEILAAALGGAHLAGEAASFLDAEGPPPATGQALIAIDPGAFGGAAVFAERIETLLGAITAEAGARLPGGKRLAARERVAREGLVVDAALLADIRRLAAGVA